MTSRSMCIPTRRRLTASTSLLLALLLASLALSLYWGHRAAAAAQLSAARENGRLQGYETALDEIGGAVGDAYRTGYQSGQIEACRPTLKSEAPL